MSYLRTNPAKFKCRKQTITQLPLILDVVRELPPAYSGEADESF
jgi:hypothetical protein